MNPLHEIRPDRRYTNLLLLPGGLMLAFVAGFSLLLALFICIGPALLMVGLGASRLDTISLGILGAVGLLITLFFLATFIPIIAPLIILLLASYKMIGLDLYPDRLVSLGGLGGLGRREVPYAQINTVSVARDWLDKKLGLGKVIIFVADDSPQGFQAYTIPGLTDPEGVRDLIEEMRGVTHDTWGANTLRNA